MLPQVIKNKFSKYIFKEFTFKIALSKNVLEIGCLRNTENKIAPSKNTFFKKLLFQNYSLKGGILKKYIFEIAFSKNINLIASIYSSTEFSESSEELSKSSIICLIISLSMYLHSLKTLADNSFHLFWEQNLSWLLLNKYD